ncbi:MAG: hypothetical protein GX329_07080 [Tissierellia bacterium]|nr:hypothetical protein [Tissierellia bacterium]
MRKAYTRNLTPAQAWKRFIKTDEEIFISNFYTEKHPVTDIKKMCKIHASELPLAFEYDGILFAQDQIELIERLMVQHLENYIESKGGIDKLELFTEEELDAMMDATYESIMNILAERAGISRDRLGQILRNESENRTKE